MGGPLETTLATYWIFLAFEDPLTGRSTLKKQYQCAYCVHSLTFTLLITAVCRGSPKVNPALSGVAQGVTFRPPRSRELTWQSMPISDWHAWWEIMYSLATGRSVEVQGVMRCKLDVFGLSIAGHFELHVLIACSCKAFICNWVTYQ